jgi:hypothetical protein
MHILKLGFRSSATDADIEGCLEALNRMREMDSVEFAVVGQCMGRDRDEFTHAFSFAVKDFETFRDEYAKDPVHREVDFDVMPHVQRLEVIDISDDMNPELESMLQETQINRAKADSELEELFREVPDASLDVPW